jgi:predicted amidohydrolase YtcJ
MRVAAGFVLYPALLILCAGCDRSGPPKGMRADAIYFGGSIITINDDQPTAEAVAVKDGKIQAVGFRTDIEKQHKGRKTELVDLAGKTLIPGFFDAHSHLSQVGLQAISANLLPPPDGSVKSIPQLQKELRDYMATSPAVKQYGVVIGFDYDDSQLAERRSPTRQELDAVSTELPIFIIHQSGHQGVYNSKALAVAGVTATTPNPTGGVIRREADGKHPNGVMEENAHFEALLKLLPKFTPEQGIQLLEAAQETYAANGFTTAQEGRADPSTLALLPQAAIAGKLKLDVVVYPDLVMNADNPVLKGPLMSRNYTNGLRLGGVKLSLDGSPQGKTAWFTKPYFQVPAGQPEDYRGSPTFTDEQAAAWVTTAYQNNWQLLAHANGDAAIDQLIRAVAAADASVPGKDRRTVLVHGQFLRNDQVARIKALGIFPALYPMHTFYWGDWHRRSVAGPERAENISPTGWMIVNHIMFSIQSDAPVTFPNSSRILASAVNRTTRTGYVLGPQHRLDPLDALKAMTLWAAYQHFEEKTKGSIEVGKIADLAILSDNPLTMPRSKLIDVKVLETIKNGKTIYKAETKKQEEMAR